MTATTTDQWRKRFTWGGAFSGDLTTEVHAGQLVVKRRAIASEYTPRVRVSVGPGIGPHYTDDPDALRVMAAQLEAAAAMLELRQASHARAKESLCP